MSYFSENLKLLRAGRGLSQSQLAHQLGLTKSAINMYERGEREPRFATMSVIAEYFGTDINSLLGTPGTGHGERIPQLRHGAGELSGEEGSLIDGYRRLDADGRAYVQRSLTLALAWQNNRGE